MPQLLFWKYDYSQDTPAYPAAQLAALPHAFDLIEWRQDAAQWTSEELSDPRWRIVAWPDAPIDSCNALIGGELPTVGENGVLTTLLQYRQNYVNLADPTFVTQLPTVLAWWEDDTRAVPVFSVPSGFSLNIAAVTVTRPPIASS